MGRFNIVFDLGKPLYAKDTKIIIEKAVLTKDNETGKVFAQIKMKNVLSKTLIAVKVVLTGYDVSGAKLEEKEFSYLDLAVKQGREFGQKTPVDFQNSTVRSFDVKITETVYSDGTKLTGTESEYYPVPEPEQLSSKLSKAEIEQYKKSNEIPSAECVVTEFSDLWICTCGEMNAIDNDICYSCGASRENLKHTLDKGLLDEEVKEEIYKEATREYNPENKTCIEKAVKRLKTIEDYKDSKELIEKYSLELERLNKIIGKKKKIKKTIKIILITYFMVLLTITVIYKKIIVPQHELDIVVKMIEQGEYTKANELLSEITYSLPTKRNAYNYVIEMSGNGENKGAYLLLEHIKYKDSEKIKTKIWNEHFSEVVNISDVVYFGHYPQFLVDGTFATYEESPIEWKVVDIDNEDKKVLLFSKYILDLKPYDEKKTSYTWENSELRKWLNTEFFDNAFNAREKSCIDDSYIINTYDGKSCGNDTIDKVFLFDNEEMLKYNSDYTGSFMTEYVLDKTFGYKEGQRKDCWTRTPGYWGVTGKFNFCKDLSYPFTEYWYSAENGVCPAIWVVNGSEIIKE